MVTWFIYFFSIGTALLSLQNWFAGLCGLIVLSGLMRYPDMPASLGGIPGLSLWNIMFAMVMLGFLRQKQSLNRPRLPVALRRSVILCALLLVVGTIKHIANIHMEADLAELALASTPTSIDIIMDEFLISLKTILPGILLYYGCDSKERLKWATLSIIGMYFFWRC